MDVTEFNRNYKRKPKKFRRTSTHNQDATLQLPLCTVRRAASAASSYSNSSRPSSEDSDDSDWDDDIPHVPFPK